MVLVGLSSRLVSRCNPSPTQQYTAGFDGRDAIYRRENDLVLFHNRGLLHSVVGAFKKDQVRAFHQCNLAASDDPLGPSLEDVKKYA